jgi:hypothetical protein
LSSQRALPANWLPKSSVTLKFAFKRPADSLTLRE